MIKLRLWHYELLDVLDNKHLVALWRECIAIKRQWEKGTLKHRLVSYVMDYDKRYFGNYVIDITTEMYKRNIKFQDKYIQEILDFCTEDNWMANLGNYPEHNDRYLRENLYNLEEKATRGIISKEEWQKIYEKYKDKFDLWNEDETEEIKNIKKQQLDSRIS